MLDDYYNQYEQIILPRRYSPKLKTKSKSNELVLSSRIASNDTKDMANTKCKDQQEQQEQHRKEHSNSHSKWNMHKLKKANMFLRQDNMKLKAQILVLQNAVQSHKELINKLQHDKESNNDYIVKLEKLVTHVKSQNGTLKKSRQEELAMTIKDSINEPLSSIQNNSNYQDSIIKRLKADNQRLREFKDAMYRISKTYDAINGDIVNIVIEIGKLFKEFQDGYVSKSGSPRHQIDFDLEIKFFGQTKQSMHTMILEMVNYVQTKQDEYNLLLNEKESDVCLLSDQIKDLTELNLNYIAALNQGDKEIQALKSQLLSFKEADEPKRNKKMIRCQSAADNTKQDIN